MRIENGINALRMNKSNTFMFYKVEDKLNIIDGITDKSIHRSNREKTLFRR